MWILAAIAAVTTILSAVLAGMVVTAQDTRADGHKAGPGLITAPVERRVIANEMTIRGDAVYADAVNLEVDVSAVKGPPVVTGRVPAVGSVLKAGSVALEVAGRPVIVLPGEVPAYRTISPGTSGNDVKQLKAALAGLGIDPGSRSSSMYDEATAAAVKKLYARVGYGTPEGEEDSAAKIRAAEDAVRQADLAVISAQRQLRAAEANIKTVRAEQDALVRTAERSLSEAEKSGPPARTAAAKQALARARQQRTTTLALLDTRLETSTLSSAQASAKSARLALTDAKKNALTSLPSSEVAFLPQLPRRIDKVQAVRGRPLQGTAMSISGATLAVRATLTGTSADRVKAGGKATITLPDGQDISATITAVGPAAASDSGTDQSKSETASSETATDNQNSQDGGSDKTGSDKRGSGPNETVATLSPHGTSEQLTKLAGTNVKVVIPVESTSDAVLAVPVAALTAGTDGQSRVEVPIGTDGRTRLVQVRIGLAAGGFVEIAGDAGLHEGDQVVVGR